MKQLRQHRVFLESILREANAKRRQVMLDHASKDQINTISEMVLNLLKKRVPITTQTYSKLKKYKSVLREIGKRKKSLKRRRAYLVSQKGSGFWQGLRGCYKACCG